MGITINVDNKRAGKARFLADMTLDAIAAGEDVLVATSVPNAFEETVQARAVERGMLVWTTIEKYGVHVKAKLF
jgi:hypothetical protein